MSRILDSDTRELLEANIRQHVQRRMGGGDVRAQMPATVFESGPSSQRRVHLDTPPDRSRGGAMRLRLGDIVDMLSELQRTVRTVVQLQVDVQRSIRMEVAAALAGRDSVAVAASPPHKCSSPPRRADAGSCVVCLDAPTECVVVRCGHMCLCQACGLEIRAQRMPCPVCRAPVTDVMRVYHQ